MGCFFCRAMLDLMIYRRFNWIKGAFKRKKDKIRQTEENLVGQ